MASKGQGLVELFGRDALQKVGNRVIRKIGRLPNAEASYFVRDNYEENKNYILSCEFKTHLYQNPNEVEEERICQIVIFFKKGRSEFFISSLRLDDVEMDDAVIEFNPDDDIYDVHPNLYGNDPNLQISDVLLNFLRNRSLNFLPIIHLFENNNYKQKLKSREPGATAPLISCTSEGYSFTLIS